MGESALHNSLFRTRLAAEAAALKGKGCFSRKGGHKCHVYLRGYGLADTGLGFRFCME